MNSVLACNCPHAFQDKTYGTGNRLHIQGKDGSFGCSVCGTKRSGNGEAQPKKKGKGGK